MEKKDIVKVTMEALGWSDYHTGGGCMALAKEVTNGAEEFLFLITMGDGEGIPESWDEPVLHGAWEEIDGGHPVRDYASLRECVLAVEGFDVDLEDVEVKFDYYCRECSRRWDTDTFYVEAYTTGDVPHWDNCPYCGSEETVRDLVPAE